MVLWRVAQQACRQLELNEPPVGQGSMDPSPPEISISLKIHVSQHRTPSDTANRVMNPTTLALRAGKLLERGATL